LANDGASGDGGAVLGGDGHDQASVLDRSDGGALRLTNHVRDGGAQPGTGGHHDFNFGGRGHQDTAHRLLADDRAERDGETGFGSHGDGQAGPLDRGDSGALGESDYVRNRNDISRNHCESNCTTGNCIGTGCRVLYINSASSSCWTCCHWWCCWCAVDDGNSEAGILDRDGSSILCLPEYVGDKDDRARTRGYREGDQSTISYIVAGYGVLADDGTDWESADRRIHRSGQTSRLKCGDCIALELPNYVGNGNRAAKCLCSSQCTRVKDSIRC